METAVFSQTVVVRHTDPLRSYNKLFLNLSMVTYQVDILDPKADQLLKDLADMNLIAIKQTNGEGFMQVIERLRSKAELLGPPTMEEIKQEVETVRAEALCQKKSIGSLLTKTFG